MARPTFRAYALTVSWMGAMLLVAVVGEVIGRLVH